jgi:ATP-binding cassette subfamily C protein LapB
MEQISFAKNQNTAGSASRRFKFKKGQKDRLREGLVLYCSLFGRQVTSAELADGYLLNDGLLPLKYIPRSLRRVGLSAQVIDIDASDIDEDLLPALLLTKTDRTLILVAWVNNKAKVLLPECGGEHVLSLEELNDEYRGTAILAKPKYRNDSRSGKYASAQDEHWFNGPLKRCWPAYSEVAVASLITNMLSIGASLFTLQVYDRVVPNGAFDTLFILAIGVILAIIFDFLLRVLRSYLLDATGKKLDVQLSSELFSTLMQIRLAAKPASTGAFSSQLREFENVRDFFTSSTAATISDLPFIFIFLGVIAYIGGAVVWVPIFTIVFMLVPSLLMQRKLASLARTNLREGAVKYGLMLEVIENLETVKTTRAEGRNLHVWEELSAQLAEDNVKLKRITSLLSIGASMTHQLCYVGVVIVGVFEISNGNLTIGGLIASTMLASRTVAPINQMTGVLVRWQHVKVALEGLEELMTSPSERPKDRQFARKPRLLGHYEIESMKYRFGQDGATILDIGKLKINAGSRIILLGSNGAGKSTLLRLLAGLIDPSEGRILLDDVSLGQIDPTDRRLAIGYLPQDIALFFGTLRENLLLDGESHTDDELFEVLDAVGLGTAVRGHSLGLDMPIANNGSVSGGQRQAIGVSRLLLQDPSIVLMDEPTAAFDQASEECFLRYLNQWLQGRTLIMSTHKKRMLAIGQRGMVLQKGKIIMDGPLEEMMSK